MEEWDRKYHRGKNPKLKTILVSASVIIATFIGLTVGERIAYSKALPASSGSVEIDGNIFYISVDWYSYIYKSEIRLVTDTNENESFPYGINATRIWFIPISGRLWPWRDYTISPLTFYRDSSSYGEYYTSKRFTLYEYDLIVEVNASDGRFFYLNKEGIYI
jgi:hypothetical protein